MSKIKSLLLIAETAAILQCCFTAAVISIVFCSSIANDNRSLGNQIDDTKIEFSAHAALNKVAGLSDNTNLQVVSLNGKVLIVGQALNTHLRDLAIKTLDNIGGIEQVYDQIRIGNITAFTTTSNDIWLTSKVKTALFGSDELDAANIKVVTENAEVFLMGLVKANEAAAAVEVARNVSGVNRVFKMFELIE